MLLRNLFYLFGPRQRILIRRIWFFPVDIFEKIFYKKKALVPPKGLIYTGAGSFTEIGDKIVNKIISECNIKPDEYVLDIGSGMGRIARPFTQYLNSSGAYYGFDVVSDGIKWCQKNYKDFKNFHFEYIPIKNDLYNLSAQTLAKEFQFPYRNDFFDLVISISVFTHMQENDVENYLFEISKVLKPGKFCFCSFFIITKESDPTIDRNSFFKYKFDNYSLHDKHVKDANIAYKLEIVEKMAIHVGLKIFKFLPGWWSNEDYNNKFDFQDIIILQKLERPQ